MATHISNLSAFKHVLKPQCFDLARRIRFLTPLFTDLQHHHDVVSTHKVPHQALASLQQALFTANQLLQFATSGSQLFMILDREEVKHKFTHIVVCFENAINMISFEKLDISEETKEQVALVTTQFRRAKEQFDPPGLQLYEHLLSVCNESYNVNTCTAELLHLICEKLQFLNMDDIKQESLALQKMVVDKGGHSQKSIRDMS